MSVGEHMLKIDFSLIISSIWTMTSQVTVTSSAGPLTNMRYINRRWRDWWRIGISATTSQIKLASCAETADQLSLFDVSQNRRWPRGLSERIRFLVITSSIWELWVTNNIIEHNDRWLSCVIWVYQKIGRRYCVVEKIDFSAYDVTNNSDVMRCDRWPTCVI